MPKGGPEKVVFNINENYCEGSVGGLKRASHFTTVAILKYYRILGLKTKSLTSLDAGCQIHIFERFISFSMIFYV